MIGLVGLQQGFDGLISDAIIAAGNENNLWGRHCYLLSAVELLYFGALLANSCGLLNLNRSILSETSPDFLDQQDPLLSPARNNRFLSTSNS